MERRPRGYEMWDVVESGVGVGVEGWTDEAR